ncbi:DNA-protecting protein DprA [Weissella diestrammenae]|uniref:DNA-protecting protein DprA n=1 Tax=Weissella diestrammenae TaxID=1162633 RepID=A0A7G9T4Y3_9LACO|nr:DNA-processing protein DprA [Weissella diestrammenae]MCM0582878.1 DNA-processing protein DprA [Weissella diestrammenae]QNN75158.1 DNA-protecting protein DprA [Weissella diestrammenae]
MKQRDFLLWLMLVPGLNIESRFLIYLHIQSMLEIPEHEMLNVIFSAGKYTPKRIHQIKQWSQQNDGMAFTKLKRHAAVVICDAIYPEALRESDIPPIVLFYRGDISLLNTPILGIVGTRNASKYGEQVVRSWVPDLASAGLTIISGLALGIDGLTHACTLAHRGKTIAVIGTGLNQYYPRQHVALQKAIAQNGLILSEYLPEMGCRKHHFPQRNRIIAALSKNLLVVEAKAKSGSLITAALALKENKSIMAVPGRITDSHSQGCNELIVAGAQPVLSVSDVMVVMAGTVWL